LPSARAAATREQLIDATESLIREGGLAAVTTQNVARRGGVAEGTIYRHFESRDELIVCAVRERLRGDFEKPAAASVREIVRTLVSLHASGAPALAMLAADPALSARNAAAQLAEGRGPRSLLEAVAKHLRSSTPAATLLVGACFYRSLMQHLFGEDPTGLDDERFASAIAQIVARGIDGA
jgi:AcrR family transcriptional regulator